jgi:hypothetical protein
MGEGEECRDDLPARGAGRGAVLAAVAVSIVLAVLGAALVDRSHSLGWDESMHAELPAARIALAVRAGAPGEALDAVLECQQYPFAYPLYLAAWQLVLGVSEGVARVAARLLWGAGLFGLFLLGREAARGATRGGALAPWLTLALGSLSPLAWTFSGTLFLEMPFAVAATYALLAFLRRDGSARRELLAGALATLAFFTRFNHGGLFGLGLALALLAQLPGELSARRGRAFAVRVLWFALPTALAFLWWFVLPLPQGFARAAEHRQALLDFLRGNLQLAPTPWGLRIVHWGAALAPSPRALLLLVAGVAIALVRWRDARVRALALVLAAMLVPIARHPFHLDRFLLPLGPPLWALAATGLAAALPRAARARAVVLAALSLIVLAGARFDSELLFDRAYGFAEDPATRAYQERVVAEWRSLSPAKPLPTNGYQREESDALLDLVAAEVGPAERVAWLGIQSELSPAALHLGLLARGGSPQRFRRDAHLVRPDGQPELCVTFEDRDPGWDGARVRAWASGFDVVITTEPIRIKRNDRAFLDEYRARLFETGEWEYEILGVVSVAKGIGSAVPVKVIACRKNR